MEAKVAADLLAILDALGFRAVVGGGWAVDALLGQQTRPHADLDLAVDADQLDKVIRVLRGLDYRPVVDWLPVRLELADPYGHRVDLHPLRFASDGSAVQAGLGDATFHYAADGFGAGRIDGQPCECLTARQQLQFRAGYDWRPADHHDVPLLRSLVGGPTADRG